MDTTSRSSGSKNAPPARATLARILEGYRRAMEASEAGVLEDVDIEALHDFRVAIRRTRTLLKFTGQVFDSRSHRRFREDFSRLAKSTGDLRDLDVFLSQWEEQTGRLRVAPATLAPMRVLLLRRRHLAFNRLVRLMRSPWYRNFRRAWKALLAREGRRAAGGGDAGAVAGAALQAAFSRVIKLGGGQRRRGSMEQLHELRKACKELRYLLEAFKELYGKDRFEAPINGLKDLQDNLGEICDFAIQQNIVRELRLRLTAEGGVALYPVMVRWAKWLRKRRDRARDSFADSYDRFVRKRNRKLFEAIA